MGGMALGILALFIYGLIIWWRNKDPRRKISRVCSLQISIPASDESKIDVAEQMFAALYSIKKEVVGLSS